MTVSPAQSLIALVDCNNFYVSCERVFRPDLCNKPVAVLSNNDGCIVSRSQEVKNLGIKMAVPVYQVEHLIKRHNIQLFSSNYALYADMSERVMQCLESYAPCLEVYSIDESFLDLTSLSLEDPETYARQIKKSIYQSTGIPVCVGMGPTKTLAKLANYAAKKWHKTCGVLDLSDPLRREKLMRIVPVSEVWGIGRQTSKRLQLMGISSAYDLAIQPVASMQAQFNIVIARIVMELSGIACLSLDEITADKQQIVCSRSFKRRLTEYHELAEALACFSSRAAEKLRQQHSVAGCISVFIRTNTHNSDEPQYQRSIRIELKQVTSDSRSIIRIAKQLLQEVFKAGYRYQKCGVILGHIRPVAQPNQMDLFDVSEQKQTKANELMLVMDNINRRFPKGIAVSATQMTHSWQTPVEYLSRHYTTNWDELLMVKCH